MLLIFDTRTRILGSDESGQENAFVTKELISYAVPF